MGSCGGHSDDDDVEVATVSGREVTESGPVDLECVAESEDEEALEVNVDGTRPLDVMRERMEDICVCRRMELDIRGGVWVWDQGETEETR